MITFETNTTIDGVQYINPKAIITTYLKTFHPDLYEIMEEMETKDEELKMTNLNWIQAVKEDAKNHPKLWSSVVLLTIFISTFIMVKFYNIYKTILENRRASAQEKMFIEMNERIQMLTGELIVTGRSS